MCSASRPSSHAAETASVKKGAPEMTRLREEASFPRAAQAFQDVPQLAGGERGNRQEHHCLRDGRNGEDTTASLKLCDDRSQFFHPPNAVQFLNPRELVRKV